MPITNPELLDGKPVQLLGKEPLAKFQEILAEMTFALENKMPELPSQLNKINELIRQHPEICHMLSEDEIGAFMKGVIQESQVQFAVASVAGRGGAKKDPLKNVNLDMLGSGGGDVQI